MITKQDVIQVARSIDKELTEEQINAVLKGYDAECKKDPTIERYFIVESLIYANTPADLFDTPELIPVEVQDVLEKHWYDIGRNTYDQCAILEKELNKIGYTIDWGLDADPYYLRKI